MLELIGKYTSAKIFTDTIEEDAISQIYGMCNHPAYSGIPLRFMPDTHLGKNVCIGTTFPISDKVSPSTIGVDLGCTISVIFYDKKVDPETYPLLEHRVKSNIPFGFEINEKRMFETKDFIKFMNSKMSYARSVWPEMVYGVKVDEKYISDMLKRINMDEGVFYKSLGSVGGGNHFLEADIDPNTGNMCWSIHCGSRNFGQKVFKYWDTIANKPISNKDLKEEIKKIKEQYKDNRKEIPAAIERYKEEVTKSKPTGFLMGEDLKGYLTDLFFGQAYAAYNHEVIKKQIDKIMYTTCNAKPIDFIQSVHNYISPKDHIARKGAIMSYNEDDAGTSGCRMVIPFNMRDGIAICKGKSNPEWNYSAPHGAGRIMSRAKAKQNLSLDEFKSTMEGIYSTTVNMSTIDEAPMAYKDMNEILENIKDTAEVLYLIKPVINIKASE